MKGIKIVNAAMKSGISYSDHSKRMNVIMRSRIIFKRPLVFGIGHVQVPNDASYSKYFSSFQSHSLAHDIVPPFRREACQSHLAFVRVRATTACRNRRPVLQSLAVQLNTFQESSAPSLAAARIATFQHEDIFVQNHFCTRDKLLLHQQDRSFRLNLLCILARWFFLVKRKLKSARKLLLPKTVS